MASRDFEEGVTITVLTVIMVLFFVLMGIGIFKQGQYSGIHSLPNCQEDEYLYPIDEFYNKSFTGPGKDTRFGCFGFDE